MVDHNMILAKFYRGEKLTRRERKNLETYAIVRAARELEHICEAVGGQDENGEEVTDAPDDGDD